MTLPRGFKANAEREAIRVRSEMGLPQRAPISVDRLATEIAGATIIDGGELIDPALFADLQSIQQYAFSAATFDIDGRKIIVTSPLATPERRASDIAHEVAHILLKHELSEVREVNGVPFRTCMPDEEEQATALGGTLLLPRPLLLAAAREGLITPRQIAKRFGVSEEMARFRLNATGAAKQAERFTGK